MRREGREAVAGILSVPPIIWCLFYLWHLGPAIVVHDVFVLPWWGLPYYVTVTLGCLLSFFTLAAAIDVGLENRFPEKK